MKEHSYFVYIMSNPNQTLYIGVTNDLMRRVLEHKLGLIDGFTKQYKLKSLVFYEGFKSIHEAIAQEKRLKGWVRQRKIDLISEANPTFKDLWSDFS